MYNYKNYYYKLYNTTALINILFDNLSNYIIELMFRPF